MAVTSSGNWISLWDLIKNRDPIMAGVSKKPSQQESRRIKYILPVLVHVIEHKEFSAKQLEKKLSISRDSIDRTIALLLSKKIIKLKRVGTRNEKFYQVDSTKAKGYRQDLANWNSFKIMITKLRESKRTRQKIASYVEIISKAEKQVRRAIKTQQFKANIVTEQFLITPLCLENKKQQTRLTKVMWPKPVSIKEMNWKGAHKIIRSFEEGRVCKTCLKSKKLRLMTMSPDGLDLVCKNGHAIGVGF